MIRLALQRLVLGIVTLLVISALVFAITDILPGDAAGAILGQESTDAARAALEARLGLDAPPQTRYLNWLTEMLRGDFGTSYATDVPVAEVIGPRLANSIYLAVVSAALAVPLSLLLGLLCAAFPDSLGDQLLTIVSLLVVSLPEFVVGLLLVLLFSVTLHLLPAVTSSLDTSSPWAVLRGLALPAITLVAAVQAHMVRMTRAAILDVMHRPYVEMARLKGASRARIILRHAVPNALGPIVNIVALNLGYLVSGVVVVEVVFGYPGLGQLIVQSVSTRDMPVIQTTAMIFCATYILLTMGADLVAMMANPRLRRAA
jgi:peptide/nickel transport system permease protein